MIKLLNIQTSKDVIASSPWVVAEGLKPHRYVIRDLGPIATVDEINEYVVHEEVLTEDEGDSIGARLTFFQTGFYTTDIKEAWEDFNDRAERSVRLLTVAGEVTYA